jgi:Ni,Fe-hydrogenase maturation factor
MSKEETMVERCARAIFDTWSADQDGYAVHRMTWQDAVRAARDPEKFPKMAKIVPLARAEARAVIDALMEPTQAMAEAGLEQLQESLGHSSVIIRDADACFRAMLSKAKAD